MPGTENSNPILMALTPEAGRAIDGPSMTIPHFPYRIGRESRVEENGGWLSRERRTDSVLRSNNDLYLLEPGRKKNVSREHLVIDRSPDGGYRVYDQGSACGTIVGEKVIGGSRRTGECGLEDGNVIVVGTAASPFAFKFQLEEE